MRIAAVGDLHIRESSSGMLKELILGICQSADLLVLCGDLTDQGLPQEAEILGKELRVCSIPVIGVLGNHDYEQGRHEEISQILAANNYISLEKEPFQFEDVGFAGVKGFCGGFDNHMLQPWGETAVKNFVYEAVNETMRLEGALARLRTEKKIAVLHYSPVRQTVEGEPIEIHPYLGSSRMVEPIDRFHVSAVFHGHAHSGMARGKTASGIPVFNVSLPLMRRMNPHEPYCLLEM